MLLGDALATLCHGDLRLTRGAGCSFVAAELMGLCAHGFGRSAEAWVEWGGSTAEARPGEGNISKRAMTVIRQKLERASIMCVCFGALRWIFLVKELGVLFSGKQVCNLLSPLSSCRLLRPAVHSDGFAIMPKKFHVIRYARSTVTRASPASHVELSRKAHLVYSM